MFKCLLIFSLIFSSAGLFAQSKDIVIKARDGSLQTFLTDSIVKIDFLKESTHALRIYNNDSSVGETKLTEIENIIFRSTTTDLKNSAESKPQPTHFILRQNYPNPFNPNTNISYQLSLDAKVVLKVYDLNGREVKTLVNEYKTAGDYNVNFNAGGLTSGIYFYTLSFGAGSVTKKMLLLR